MSTETILEIEQFGFPMWCVKEAGWMTNSVDPDQTAPQEAVWSGSRQFCQTYLS